jgi:hypothetical protein
MPSRVGTVRIKTDHMHGTTTGDHAMGDAVVAMCGHGNLSVRTFWFACPKQTRQMNEDSTPGSPDTKLVSTTLTLHEMIA